MFEDKKWSEALKKQVVVFLNGLGPGNRRKFNIADIIDLALEEGRQEVLDDPRKWDLVSKDECREREPTY